METGSSIAGTTTNEQGIDSGSTDLGRRNFLIGAGAVGGTIAAGGGYQAIGTYLDRSKYPPPGELIDVGTHRLHLNFIGNEQAGPTVVFEAGAGDFSLGWHGFQEQVAEFAPVVSSDRTGLGWSERGAHPPSAGRAADELYTALQTADIPGPYVLVGHSYGGGVIRLFAHRHPEVVAGLVFVDSSDEIVANPSDALLTVFRAIGLTTHIGVLRLAASLGALPILPDHIDDYPLEVRDAYVRIVTGPNHFSGLNAEYGNIKTVTADELRAATDLGDLPVTVIHRNGQMPEGTTANDIAFEEEWQEAQLRLADLSTNSERIVADTHEHFIHPVQPELVLDAIETRVVEARQNE